MSAKLKQIKINGFFVKLTPYNADYLKDFGFHDSKNYSQLPFKTKDGKTTFHTTFSTEAYPKEKSNLIGIKHIMTFISLSCLRTNEHI